MRSRPALPPQTDLVQPLQAPQQAVAASLHRRRERLHRFRLREPETALHDQLGSQVRQFVEPRRRDADRPFRDRSRVCVAGLGSSRARKPTLRPRYRPAEALALVAPGPRRSSPITSSRYPTT